MQWSNTKINFAVLQCMWWTMTYLVGDGSEGILNLLAALHVLCLLGDHEGHVLLQGYEAIPKWKDS